MYLILIFCVIEHILSTHCYCDYQKKNNRYFLNFCFSSVFFTYRGKNGILLFSLELFQPVNVYIFVTFFR